MFICRFTKINSKFVFCNKLVFFFAMTTVTNGDEIIQIGPMSQFDDFLSPRSLFDALTSSTASTTMTASSVDPYFRKFKRKIIDFEWHSR